MALPVVAIIGRPNVGKSILLNSLAGQMISIVEPTAGVTRDRVTALVERNGSYFELVDTGGYGIVDKDQLSEHIEAQIHQAIARADLAIFMVDIRDGVVPLDEQIAKLLRKTKREVILVASKADHAALFPAAAELTKLGFGEALCVSALNNMNKNVLLDQIVERIAHLSTEKPEKAVMKIAIVGKRNTGKSTLLNAIVGAERVIVSDLPGTTRDAVDVRFQKDGQIFIAIDTAGIRKKAKMSADSIEFYSYTRATHAIKRADVVLFMIDATLSLSQVDKKLAKFISEQYKTSILVINKWDLAKDHANTEDYKEYLDKTLPGLRYAPIAFTTATKQKNVQRLLDVATELFKQATTTISTATLNKATEVIKAERVGGTKKAKLPKIYYATQISTNPITLLLFVNRPELFEENYQRFIVSRLREYLPIAEVPIRLLLRQRRQ